MTPAIEIIVMWRGLRLVPSEPVPAVEVVRAAEVSTETSFREGGGDVEPHAAARRCRWTIPIWKRPDS